MGSSRTLVQIQSARPIQRGNEMPQVMENACMDNFELKFTCHRREPLDQALALAFLNAAGGKAVGYRIQRHTPPVGEGLGGGQEVERLILYWAVPDRQPSAEEVELDLVQGNDPRVHPLPGKGVGPKVASEFVWEWLQNADYPDEPDHDGSNSRGFRIYNEAWGHVDSDSYAFIAIEPAWAWHGK